MSFADARDQCPCREAEHGVRVRVLSEVSVSPYLSGRTAPASAVRATAQDDTEDRAVDGEVVPGVAMKPESNDESVVLGFDENDYLEKEDEVPASDLAEFTDRMNAMGVERGTDAWRSHWRAHAEARLRFMNPQGYAEYERRRGKRQRRDGESSGSEEREGRAESSTARSASGQEESGAPPTPTGAPEPEPREGRAEPERHPERPEEDGDWADLEDGGEEARLARMCPPCRPPSAEEVRQHRISGHCTFRNWCPTCVAAAADDRAHSLRAEQEGSVPEVACDYAFFRNRRGDKVYLPVLVSKVRKQKGFNAHAVPSKGTGGGWIVQQFLRDLRKWGLRSDVILKSDGEAAIKDLLNRVGDLRGQPTQLETSPATDSRANGLAERAVQSVQKQVRTLKLALERNLECRVEVTHPCFPWLIEHAADVLNKFLVNPADGRTAWERLKGRRYSGLMFEFGTKILYRVPQKPQGGAMEPRWLPGVWLGKRFESDEHIIALEDGRVVRSGTVRAYPGVDFDQVLLDGIVGKPWDPKGTGVEQGNLHQEQPRAGDLRRPPPAPEPDPVAPQRRRLAITKRFLDRAGYTPGCLKCRHMQTGDNSRPTLGHSEACRDRVEEFVRNDPALRNLWDRAQGRVGRPEPGAAEPEAQAGGDEVPEESAAPRVRARSEDGAAAPSDGPEVKRARAEADDVDTEMPIPPVATEENPEASEQPAPKRARVGSEAATAEEDPLQPEAEEVGLVATLSVKSVRHIDRPGKFDICEVFSPPRVTEHAGKHGLRPGWSLDVRCADGVTGRRWDLTSRSDQDAAFEMLRRDKPHTVILCPPCTKFCALLRLSRTQVDRREWLDAVRMVNVAVKMAEIQLDGGRHFVFEHPLTASSWRLPSLQRLRRRAGVLETVIHQCRYGLVSEDREGLAPAKKPTRLLTSSTAIRDELCLRCDGGHRHVQLISGRPAAAQTYPPGLCEAIVRGVVTELLCRGERAQRGQARDHREQRAAEKVLAMESEEAGVIYEVIGDDDHVEDGAAYPDYFVPVPGDYIDDTNGKPLDSKLAQAGRAEELIGFDARGVYEIRSRAWALANGIPILGSRWVDKQKGNRVRSRLVVQDFNFKKNKLGPDELFAPTPPLIAARYAASRCASCARMPRRLRRQLMTLDFEKAFLNGSVLRDVCIALPPEDSRADGGANVGYLRRAMYGLREAPAIWQDVVRDLMCGLGYVPCPTMPCVYRHPVSDVVVVAHVDDFLACGDKAALVALKAQLQSNFECDGEILGGGDDEVRELKFLGRRIAWTSTGLEWRGDRRQIDAFIEKCGLSGACGVDTPGVKHDRNLDAPPMSAEEATAHRSLVALANYISQDRPDLSFASKDLSQTMATPLAGDGTGLKRLGRYLREYPEVALVYDWQDEPVEVVGYSDSDWGGCAVTRRSTSGGVLMHGKHVLGYWAKTQQTVSLSSCEAEINGLVKCAVEGLGLRNLVRHCGVNVGLRLLTDASAAVGVCRRQGAGKQKHLSVKQLWAQGQEARGELTIDKIPRIDNIADLFTHHATKADLEKFLAGMKVRRSRHCGRDGEEASRNHSAKISALSENRSYYPTHFCSAVTIGQMSLEGFMGAASGSSRPMDNVSKPFDVNRCM